jgi:hypothetical protein
MIFKVFRKRDVITGVTFYLTEEAGLTDRTEELTRYYSIMT